MALNKLSTLIEVQNQVVVNSEFSTPLKLDEHLLLSLLPLMLLHFELLAVESRNELV